MDLDHDSIYKAFFADIAAFPTTLLGLTGDIWDEQIIKVTTKGLCLGHWIAPEHDLYHVWRQQVDEEINLPFTVRAKRMEFLLEQDTNLKPIVRFDLDRRCIELEVPSRHANTDNPLFADVRDYMIIRFNTLMHNVELCHENSTNRDDTDGKPSYAIVLSLKYPPKLEMKIPNSRTLERSLCFGSLTGDNIGKSPCIKILLDQNAVNTLTSDANLKSLKKSGIFHPSLWNGSDMRIVRNQQLDLTQKGGLQTNLEWLDKRRPRIGK
jgi:hypothetical protein